MAAKKISPLSVFSHAEKFPKSPTAKLVYVLRFTEASALSQLQLAKQFPLATKDYFEGRAYGHWFTAGLIAEELGLASRLTVGGAL